MNRWPRLGILLVVVSLIALSLIGAATATPLSPAEQVQAAWRSAQASGVYQYTTEIVQTTYPAPLLVNVGRSAREDRLHIEGQTNLPNREMLMTLWQNSGNVATGRDGVEVRITGDEAYGRTAGTEEWQKIDNFSSVFAPGQDLMAYLAGAKNVREVTANAGDYAIRFTQYVFDLDGPAFGRYVRDQLEAYLAEKGELPPGVSLVVRLKSLLT